MSTLTSCCLAMTLRKMAKFGLAFLSLMCNCCRCLTSCSDILPVANKEFCFLLFLSLFFHSDVAAQKMNPGVLGMVLQQRQDKEKLRCKQQNLPQQNTPQVGPPVHSFPALGNQIELFSLHVFLFAIWKTNIRKIKETTT